MSDNRISRQKLKTFLISITAMLSVIFALVLFYGTIFVMPKSLSKAIALGQYYEFNSSDLPSGNSSIKTDGAIAHNKISTTGSQNEATPATEKPRISILLTNLGLNQISTELALTLPKEIALGFMPYTTSLKPLIAKAQELEHEIFIYIPFETKRYPSDSPGQMPILLSLSDQENIQRLSLLLSSFEGYIGVYGSYKEIFTADMIKSNAVMNELRKRNLKLLIGRIDNAKEYYGENSEGIISADIILDSEPNVAAIKNNLDKLIEISKTKKRAVAYAQAYPVTIYTLKAWLPTLEEQGIEVVAISDLEKVGSSDKTP